MNFCEQIFVTGQQIEQLIWGPTSSIPGQLLGLTNYLPYGLIDMCYLCGCTQLHEGPEVIHRPILVTHVRNNACCTAMCFLASSLSSCPFSSIVSCLLSSWRQALEQERELRVEARVSWSAGCFSPLNNWSPASVAGNCMLWLAPTFSAFVLTACVPRQATGKNNIFTCNQVWKDSLIATYAKDGCVSPGTANFVMSMCCDGSHISSCCYSSSLKHLVLEKQKLRKHNLSSLLVIDCFLCWRANEKSFLKAQLMIQCLKNELSSADLNPKLSDVLAITIATSSCPCRMLAWILC